MNYLVKDFLRNVKLRRLLKLFWLCSNIGRKKEEIILKENTLNP